MRRRFYVERFDDVRATLRGEAAHHLGRVLRAEAGQLYELSDGERVWLGGVERAGRDAIEFALIEELVAEPPRLSTTLLLAIVKFDRFEWAIEKATELGVTEIVPVAARRSEKALAGAAAKRIERWRRIALEAAQQSRRLRPPQVLEPLRAEESFLRAHAPLRLILSESKEAAPLREALRDVSAASVTLAIGPEGGWTDEEFSAARRAGFVEASLGRNILRTETAVITALASLHYALGD